MNFNQLDDILFQVQKPARYTGNEWNSVIKDWDKTSIRIALAFPDIYEIGMSNLALPILYQILNDQPDTLAERVYAPWVDLEAALRHNHIPLFSLETRHNLAEFDIIGFSLGYELTYTNVLNMLDLAQIPVLSRERTQNYPLVIAGGGCALNPEPMSDFIDIFFIGEAEETILNFLSLFREYKNDRKQLLKKAAVLPGIYVPGGYRVEYYPDGTIKRLVSLESETPLQIRRQIFSRGPVPVIKPVVPYIETIHDRGAIELQRGCSRGCRFCQAGIIYRPVRQLSHDKVIQCTREIIKNCGYNEISFISLSTGDYHDLNGLINKLKPQLREKNISLSLPSLHLDRSSLELIESLPQKRKITLTFAPEAGSERLRKAINKNIPEQLILDTLAAAFSKGWMNLKLYFMIGLPTETTEDVVGITELIARIMNLTNKSKPRIRINVSTFVPKSHTPCQWLPQDSAELLTDKQEILRRGLRRSNLQLSWQDTRISQLEAVLSRGDRRLGKVIHDAWLAGCKYDTWNEYFNYATWLKAFEHNNIDPLFYINRARSFEEILPWNHIDIGVTDSFLKREYGYISEGKETPDCRTEDCNACGLQQWQESCREKLKQTGENG
jgi:radical SAM family uncharacterized protein